MNLRPLRALLPVAVLAGLSACTAASPTPTPVAITAPPASSTTPAALPTSAPTSTSASKPTPTPTTAAEPAKTVCPASVAALQRASGLPNTHKIDPAQIRCARRWATAGVIARNPEWQGDGVIVFEYTAGRWKKLGETSAPECTPYGIPEEIGDQIGCHDR